MRVWGWRGYCGEALSGDRDGGNGSIVCVSVERGGRGGIGVVYVVGGSNLGYWLGGWVRMRSG